jgi:NAD(P)-dependent dehydrogenase (short-subunit alcohol dehydrogenase family)
MNTDRKVAIVTGASQGIGAGVVEAYRGLGYAVVANSRTIERGEDPNVIAIAGDIGDRAVAEEVVRTATERFGRIDTLINNAGIFIGKPFTDYRVEDFERALHINVAGFFHVTQLVVPHMLEQRRGHIVQITTALVDQPIAGAPSGLAGLTKGGLAAVTRGLAIEYADRGLRVNAVAPGIIRTPMHAPETLGALGKLHPMGRLGEVEDVVKAIVYLEQAPFVTGEILNVDGGQHAGR